jgi:[acyl-carrier-protein] S-malonyltransferase
VKLAILCSGQGTQHASMFELIAADAVAQETLAKANAAAGFDVLSTARNSSDIFRNAIAQPLLCAYSTAVWSALAPRLPEPALFAGYSAGELAAYGCAGALPAFDIVRLACQRAAFMDADCEEATGLLALRGLTRRSVDAVCAAFGVELAIVNGEEQYVVGGQVAALDKVESQIAALRGTAQRLKVTIAAHTSLLASAATRLHTALASSRITSPAIPVVAGISGALVVDREAAITTLARQVCSTVQWSACLDTAFERGCRVFVELGPGNALARMVRERFSDVTARSLAEFRSLDAVAVWVQRTLA